MPPNPYEEKLKAFVQDEVLFGAIRSILLAEFDMNISYDKTVPGTERYEQVQAILNGREKLIEGFKKLERYKDTGKTPQPDGNRNGV